MQDKAIAKEGYMQNWQRFSWGGEWSQGISGHPKVYNDPGGLDHLRTTAALVACGTRFLSDGTAEPDMGWQQGDDDRKFSVMSNNELRASRTTLVA